MGCRRYCKFAIHSRKLSGFGQRKVNLDVYLDFNTRVENFEEYVRLSNLIVWSAATSKQEVVYVTKSSSFFSEAKTLDSINLKIESVTFDSKSNKTLLQNSLVNGNQVKNLSSGVDETQFSNSLDVEKKNHRESISNNTRNVMNMRYPRYEV